MERIKISYTGTNVGSISLSDIVGNIEISHNRSLILDLTDQVKKSLNEGVIKYFSTVESNDLFYGSAPFVISNKVMDIHSIYNNMTLNALFDVNGYNFCIMTDSKKLDIKSFADMVNRMKDGI